ncbi:MAG: hypothetical protein QXH20_06480, partial [Candidatus Bathyarchaeia archaeon]
KGLTATQLAERFRVSEPRVWQILKRMKVEKEARKKILQKAFTGQPLSGKHIEVIASLPEEKQPKLVEIIAEKGLSAKETRKVAKALAAKPEVVERILELPKPKLVEEAERIVAPPLRKTPEEIILERAEEARRHYPPIVVDYVVTRYKGKHLEDVLKAVFWRLWSRLDEAGRENVTAEAIRLAGEKGFVQPIVG